jgi:ADP-heptose:LPS heptosyltransferase
MSLPIIFKTDLHSIPSSQKYININSYIDKLEKWDNLLNKKQRPQIGVAWSGNPSHKNDQNRSISLDRLLNHLPDTFKYISLHNEIRTNDVATLKANNMVLDASTYLSDFSDTAALIHYLDLVITVDTSLAHLSGAIGKNTWLLLPFAPDWRWLLNREDSPWYASIKIYRQKKLGDWDDVLQEVGADLNNLEINY